MVALARMGRDLHFPEQGVHFRDGKDAPCPHRTVAGHGCGDMVQPVAKGQRGAQLRKLGGDIVDQTRNIRLAERGRYRPHQYGRRAEPLQLKAQCAQVGSGAFQAVAVRFVQLDDFRDQQRLASDLPVPGGFAHALQDKPFVGSVLIDDDETVFGFGDDVGCRDLAAGDAERISGNRCDCGLRAGSRLVAEVKLSLGYNGAGYFRECGNAVVARKFIACADWLGLPVDRRRELLPGGAAMAGLVQRCSQAATGSRNRTSVLAGWTLMSTSPAGTVTKRAAIGWRSRANRSR